LRFAFTVRFFLCLGQFHVYAVLTPSINFKPVYKKEEKKKKNSHRIPAKEEKKTTNNKKKKRKEKKRGEKETTCVLCDCLSVCIPMLLVPIVSVSGQLVIWFVKCLRDEKRRIKNNTTTKQQIQQRQR
jgi:adenosyl cobinamide kinase/adenosyl cobinamide phosphate guanylyltransferase